MMSRNKCPNCTDRATEKVHQENHEDIIVEIFTCTQCKCQYENILHLDEQKVTDIE